MLTIHKFRINDPDYPVIVPKSAALLKVAMQGGHIINAWYCMDTEDTDTRIDKYHIFGTGRDISCPVDIDYVDTIFENTGYVWHVYKETQ